MNIPLAAALAISACGGATIDPQVAGSWRIYGETISYDAGGSNRVAPVSTRLEIDAAGSWQFGSSSGVASVDAIPPDAWTRWQTAPYAPTRRIVLSGWNGAGADGPIEEEPAQVDFLWVIYRTTTALGGATVQIKFGR